MIWMTWFVSISSSVAPVSYTNTIGIQYGDSELGSLLLVLLE